MGDALMFVISLNIFVFFLFFVDETIILGSWLNPVEIWFGILNRPLLKRGRFPSPEAFNVRILAFIEFFNETLAKPFRWTYIDKPLLVLIIECTSEVRHYCIYRLFNYLFER